MADDPGSSAPRPAYARDSMMLSLGSTVSLDDLSPQWAWGGATGAGVRIAVIDSGIEAGHEHLGDSIAVDDGVAVTVTDDGEVIEIPGNHDDDIGHGTACASIIHAFAPQAKITSFKVMGQGVSGKAAAFLRALGLAIERGYDVINLSLGTGKRDWALPFYEVCDHAYFRGSLIVTAANNTDRPSFPSLYASVVSVACNVATQPFRFHYNPDPPTEFLARGIDVDVAWRGGTYIRATGNSFAAPHISGIAALVRSKHPELRPFQVKAVLYATSANVREAEQPAPAGRRATISRAVTMSPRATSALRAVGSGPA